MSRFDYEITGTVSASTVAELARILQDRKGKPVRLLGSGSSQDSVPPAPEPVQVVTLAGMDRIVHFEPDDQTCSVEPGVTRARLDAVLAEKRLCLPCAGTGTIGGIFASGELGPLAPGAPSPRSLLLGLEGVLSDGTHFQSGARVVKSVTGFDLHKLFVGSRGRLFAATTLHLKVQPLPRARLHCAESHAEAGSALARFLALRATSPSPRALAASRTEGVWSVVAHYEGGSRLLDRLPTQLGVTRCDGPSTWHVVAPPASEVIAGVVRASRLQRLVNLVPPAANFYVDAGGRFEVALEPEAADALLSELPAIEAHAEIRRGARHRRGRTTPLDPASVGLCSRIKKALDPEGVLL